MTADAVRRWTTALLTVLLAVSLAQLTWRLWPAATLPEPPPRPVADGSGGAAGESPLQQAQRVAALHLFGAPSERAVPARPEARDAPETQLDLTLHGVVATGNPVTARAIIQHGRGDERPYRLGDEIPGGAVIREILTDRVVLERNGRYETLRLPREPLSQAGEGGPEPAGGAARLSSRLSDYRQRLLREPAKVDRLLRVQPVTEGGRLKGYRLDPRADRELFQAAGLRAGDVLTSVNGMRLDDPTRLGEVIDQLSTSDRLTLTVERGGRSETVVVRLGDSN